MGANESSEDLHKKRRLVWPPQLISQTPLGYLQDGKIYTLCQTKLELIHPKNQATICLGMAVSHLPSRMGQCFSNSEIHSVTPSNGNSSGYHLTPALSLTFRILALLCHHTFPSKMNTVFVEAARNKCLLSCRLFLEKAIPVLEYSRSGTSVELSRLIQLMETIMGCAGTKLGRLIKRPISKQRTCIRGLGKLSGIRRNGF